MIRKIRTTPEEQLALRQRAKEELHRLRGIMEDEETIRMVEAFKTKFTVCEIVYKVVLAEHQLSKTGLRPERMQITMTQVPHALHYAGYDFDRELLTRLFGAADKSGTRSAKKLRDALTHSMNPKAIEELNTREKELHADMDAFLNKIASFDTVA